MVLAVLTVAAMEARSAEDKGEGELPLGFLEYLGAMVEVESAAGSRLVDPLDLQEPLEPEEPEEPARLEWDAPAGENPQGAKEVLQ
jgi:hypothetical protein